MDEKNQQQANYDLDESKVVEVMDEGEESTFDILDDFKCGELLLDADEDRGAFEIFLRIATEDKKNRKAAIDKLFFIALKNSHNPSLLDNHTWKRIEKLSKKGKGYEFAHLLLHFKYYSDCKNVDDQKKAYKHIKNYFDAMHDSKQKGKGISPIAYLQYGICLEWGIGIEADEVSAAEALKYYSLAKKRCALAYKHIASAYLFGAEGVEKDRKKAKRELNKGLDCITKKYEKGEKEIIPFFKEIVGLCFKGDMSNDKVMVDKGKEKAQYMIDKGIKGGFDLMGDANMAEFNITMAKNYYEEAIKYNEIEACGSLSYINFFEENKEESFKLAYKGSSKNESWSFDTLGRLYEDRGNNEEEKGNNTKAKKSYRKAWDYFEKAYYNLGINPEHFGHLYLEKAILPKSWKDNNEFERIMKISSKQNRPECIKYYLRLIQKNNGKDFATINPKIAHELPEISEKDYLKYLNVWVVYTDDTDIDKDILSFVYEGADDKTKATLFKKLVKDSDLYRHTNNMEFVYQYADETTKEKLFKKLVEDPDLYWHDNNVEFVYQYADESTKKKLSKKIVEDTRLRNEFMDSVFKNAGRKTKAILSKKLVEDSYYPSNKKQFVEIIENYGGEQDDTFVLWLNKTLSWLYFIENGNNSFGLFSEIKDVIENSEDEVVKESWRSCSAAMETGASSIDYNNGEAFNIVNLSDELSKLLSAIENSNDEKVKSMVDKLNVELRKFFDSCFTETPSESYDDDVKNDGDNNN